MLCLKQKPARWNTPNRQAHFLFNFSPQNRAEAQSDSPDFLLLCLPRKIRNDYPHAFLRLKEHSLSLALCFCLYRHCFLMMHLLRHCGCLRLYCPLYCCLMCHRPEALCVTRLRGLLSLQLFVLWQQLCQLDCFRVLSIAPFLLRNAFASYFLMPL